MSKNEMVVIEREAPSNNICSASRVNYQVRAKQLYFKSALRNKYWWDNQRGIRPIRLSGLAESLHPYPGLLKLQPQFLFYHYLQYSGQVE